MGQKKIFEEIMAKWSPNLVKDIINWQVQEVQQTPRRINMMKIDLFTSLDKPLKAKDKGNILKAIWGKWHFTFRGTIIWVFMDFSLEIMDTRREWNNVFKGHKGKKPCQPRVLYPAKICFNKEGKIHFQIKEC